MESFTEDDLEKIAVWNWDKLASLFQAKEVLNDLSDDLGSEVPTLDKEGMVQLQNRLLQAMEKVNVAMTLTWHTLSKVADVNTPETRAAKQRAEKEY